MSRGFISLGLILVLIIAAALIGGGAYYAGKHSPAMPPGQEAASTTPGENGQANNNAPAENPSQPGTKQPATVASCEAFANIHRGDTDATTGGKVSKLQAFLDISPTGSYGPLTEIGYTNKCIGGNAAPDSVAGMSKYTDTDFGFSFWYPAGWTVTGQTVQSPTNSGWFGGGTLVKQFKVAGSAPSSGVTIYEFHSSSASITEFGATRSASPVGVDQKYFFDSAKGVWMYENLTDTPNGQRPAGTVTIADVSNNTMGGLHIFQGAERFGDDVIVPLSASDFVVVTENSAGADLKQWLVATIVATDPTVAVPVSTAEQIKTIEAERAAYGSATSDAFTATPTSGAVPLSASFDAPAAEVEFKDYGVDFGDGSPLSGFNGLCGGLSNAGCGMTHTYASKGTYTAKLITGANCSTESNICANPAHAEVVSSITIKVY